ncbi:MAG: biotin carboxylase N-terminal domain-containing protein [Acidimicrobiales bacterium]
MSSGCRRLLVANRGEIARRVIKTARAMGIETVAVYSDGDAEAPFVGDADRAVALEGRSAAETYLDQEKLLEAAQRTGADSVHPGYGFLSENADFASAVIDAGLTWVGPPPSAIASMGDKLAAKRIMVDAGVPTLPSIEVIPDTDLAAAGDEIGYPVLVKAAAGGGGKGMRVVESPADLVDAVAGAQREAEASFGDGTVFLEKYITASRHVEIQVLGDQHGNLVHCFERECSIQRRHQKIIEEAPSPAVGDGLRQAMGDAALAAARAVGYHSAGTVEFLLAERAGADDPGFYFLEVNTRLQVEHPVTEEITGLDLVRQQLLVAQGEMLGFDQADLGVRGHAIEARLYAEDVEAGFLPATGTLAAFATAADAAARLDSGVEAGSVIGVDFDPMLAKVIVHADTRREAALRLALVLERMTIAGVTTNRDFLVRALRNDGFLAGDTTTDFVERYALVGAVAENDDVALLVAAALFRQANNRKKAGPLAFMRSGYRNSVMPPEQLILHDGAEERIVCYRSHRNGSFEITVGVETTPVVANIVGVSDSAIEAVIDGVRGRFDVVVSGAQWHVQGPNGRADFTERSRFPDTGHGTVAGGQVAPMPGSIRVVAVSEGDHVEAGAALVVLEAMKMEHTVVAPADGVVSEIRCAVGDQVDNGEVLVVLVPADAAD